MVDYSQVLHYLLFIFGNDNLAVAIFSLEETGFDCIGCVDTWDYTVSEYCSKEWYSPLWRVESYHIYTAAMLYSYLDKTHSKTPHILVVLVPGDWISVIPYLRISVFTYFLTAFSHQGNCAWNPVKTAFNHFGNSTDWHFVPWLQENWQFLVFIISPKHIVASIWLFSSLWVTVFEDRGETLTGNNAQLPGEKRGLLGLIHLIIRQLNYIFLNIKFHLWWKKIQ